MISKGGDFGGPLTSFASRQAQFRQDRYRRQRGDRLGGRRKCRIGWYSVSHLKRIGTQGADACFDNNLGGFRVILQKTSSSQDLLPQRAGHVIGVDEPWAFHSLNVLGVEKNLVPGEGAKIDRRNAVIHRVGEQQLFGCFKTLGR